MLAKLHERVKLIERLQVALDVKEAGDLITILGWWMSLTDLLHCVETQEGHIPTTWPSLRGAPDSSTCEGRGSIV